MQGKCLPSLPTPRDFILRMLLYLIGTKYSLHSGEVEGHPVKAPLLPPPSTKDTIVMLKRRFASCWMAHAC